MTDRRDAPYRPGEDVATEPAALWIVAKTGGYRRPAGVPPEAFVMAEYEHPMFFTTLDEDEARKAAQHVKAALVRVPITEDYREGER